MIIFRHEKPSRVVKLGEGSGANNMSSITPKRVSGYTHFGNELLESDEFIALTPTERLLIIYITRFTNQAIGTAWPSRERLARLVGVNDRSITRLAGGLVEQGWLQIEYRTGATSHYRVTPVTDDTPVTDNTLQLLRQPLETTTISDPSGSLHSPVVSGTLSPKESNVESESTHVDLFGVEDPNPPIPAVPSSPSARVRAVKKRSDALAGPNVIAIWAEAYEKHCGVRATVINGAKDGANGKRLLTAIISRFANRDPVDTLRACVEAAFELADGKDYPWKGVTQKSITLSVITQENKLLSIFEHIETDTQITPRATGPRKLLL